MKIVPLITSFKERIRFLTGKRIDRHNMSVVHNGRTPLDELSFLARLTKLVTRTPIELIPAKKIKVIMHTDINRDTGRLYPDYEKRREQKKGEAEKELAAAEAINWDIDPD